jgi:predicted O-methyltransferase YrrM
MLEKIGPANPTTSTPAPGMSERITDLMSRNPSAVVAEVGVGIGATTQVIAAAMRGRGTLHLFDFQEKVEELAQDLAALGFTNTVGHGNTGRFWDSYHWSLAKLLEAERRPIFDYVYLDGSHLLLHDLAAFALLDKLLKPGGLIEFDDYGWSLSRSNWLRDNRLDYMTEEQVNAKQVKMLVDLFVKTNPNYRMQVKNRVFRKRKSGWLRTTFRWQ